MEHGHIQGLGQMFGVPPTGWAKKTGPFLRVYNLATVGARNARDMSKFSKFYPQNNVKVACQCV